MGFMIQIWFTPFCLSSLNFRMKSEASEGMWYVWGKKSSSFASSVLPSFSRFFFILFRFFTIRSFRVSSTWFGKWLTFCHSFSLSPPLANPEYGRFSWIQPVSA